MKKSLKRLLFFLCIILLGNLFAQKSERPKSDWVYFTPDRKLVYKTTPAGDKIIDFSYAGYMGGGVALPEVPVKLIVGPTGSPDETALIQVAIDSVAKMPLKGNFRGAVLLANGTFTCSGTISITGNGVVLRGSGSGADGTIIKMVGEKHTAIVIDRQGRSANNTTSYSKQFKTFISDDYVPSGAISFTVEDASGFEVGYTINIEKPVTESWVHFMQMDNLKRYGKRQTWIQEGNTVTIQRTIKAITGNKITLDVPLTDSYDSKYLNPPGTEVRKTNPLGLVSQSGVEYLRIQAPPMEMSYEKAPYSAIRINGEDCWAKDIHIEETMNSIKIEGRRITLERVNIDRTVPNLGASKPAEFAPNASQLLLNRCSSYGDNIWHAGTGAGKSGSIVLLNCTFGGRGHIEGHQRWTTGMLLDNCILPEGGIDFRNRGAMGSGHGWAMGWAVAWNCIAKTYVVQQPPGAYNWMIGCTGQNIPTARPFDTGPTLPLGICDSPGEPVAPKSLYLAQLLERLGPQALINIGYSPDNPEIASGKFIKSAIKLAPVVDKVYGLNLAAHKLANTSNVRHGQIAFNGQRALDGDLNTYWSTDDDVTKATLEIDLEDPQVVNAVEIREAEDMLQKVQEYKVEGMVDSDWKLLAQGTLIGERKIDHFPAVTAWKVKLTILKTNSPLAISEFGLYNYKYH